MARIGEEVREGVVGPPPARVQPGPKEPLRRREAPESEPVRRPLPKRRERVKQPA